MPRFSQLTLAVCILASLTAIADSSSVQIRGGVLDEPVPGASIVVTPDAAPPTTFSPSAPLDPQSQQQAVQDALEDEQEDLEKLPRAELLELAEQGERAAQITLAADFAAESGQLAFSPEAANDALSDAVEWYSKAAERGFPGAPSLDYAGVRYYPIRMHRAR